MKRISPLEQERRRYSRQLAAHTFRQWYAAHEQASNQHTQTISSESGSNGGEGADERPPNVAKQDNKLKASQPYHAKKGPQVIDFAPGSPERGRQPSKKDQSNSNDQVE